MSGRLRAAVAASVIAVSATLGATQAAAESLAEALTSAYNHSGLIEQNRATLRAADEDVAGAMAGLRPVLRWTGNIQRSFGSSGPEPAISVGTSSQNTTLGLTAEWVIYAGGRNALAVESAKETVLATRAALVSVEQQVLLNAVSAFMEVRRALETVALRQNNVRVIRQEVRAAKDRFEVGEITRTDVALAEARLSAAQSQLAGARGALVSAQEAYARFVGHRPGKLVTPRGLPRIPASVKQAKAQSVRSHPDMIRVQHTVAASELGVKIARGATKPSVSLRSTYAATESFDDKSFRRAGTVELNAGGPIYSGGALASAIRKAQAQRDNARAELHVLRHALREGVGNAYVSLEVARASRSAFESQVRAATVAFRGVREEAKLGARTTLDVLDAEQELLDARASLISAQVDETLAAYQVLASIGLLTAENLHLNVPKFDPSEYYNMVKSAPASVSKQGRDLDRVLRALGKN